MVGCAAGMILIVSRRRCVQILGPGSDSSLASSLVFLAGLVIGWLLFRSWGKIKDACALPNTPGARAVPARSNFGTQRTEPISAPLSFVLAAASRDGSRSGHCVAILILSTMAAIVVGQRLSPVLNLLVSGVADLRALGFANAVTCGLAAAVLELLPAVGIGMQLAWFVIQGERDRPGRSNQRPADWLRRAWKRFKCGRVGQRNEVVGGTPATAGGTPALPETCTALRVYLCFLFGSLFGFLTASRWLISHMGTLPAVAFCLILLTTILALMTFRQILAKPSAILPMALAGILIYSLGTGLGDAYLYGHRQTGNGPSDVEYFRVGASGDVRVSRNEGSRALEFDGLPIAGTGSDLAAELGLAYFPRLLRPNASKVLIIGLGTGAACGASLLFPQSQVICAESEPAIVSAMNLFTDVNHLQRREEPDALEDLPERQIRSPRPKGEGQGEGEGTVNRTRPQARSGCFYATGKGPGFCCGFCSLPPHPSPLRGGEGESVAAFGED